MNFLAWFSSFGMKMCGGKRLSDYFFHFFRLKITRIPIWFRYVRVINYFHSVQNPQILQTTKKKNFSNALARQIPQTPCIPVKKIQLDFSSSGRSSLREPIMSPGIDRIPLTPNRSNFNPSFEPSAELHNTSIGGSLMLTEESSTIGRK